MNKKINQFCVLAFIRNTTIIIVAFSLLAINSNAQTYDLLAVQKINDLIANNGLQATPNAPETWGFATWNENNPKQLTMLLLHSQNLTGTAIFEGLITLEGLGLIENNLSELNLINCLALKDLNCAYNNLFGIDLSNLASLLGFNGFGQEVYLTLKESVQGEYSVNIELNNPTFWDDAITYSDGILTSTNSNVSSTTFAVQTGKAGFELSGTMNFTYSDVSIFGKELSNSLIAYVENDKLLVNGLKISEEWSVYTISGILVYKGVATKEEEGIILKDASGVYVVRSGSESVKVVSD